MGIKHNIHLLFATAASVAAAGRDCISTVSWGDPRVDLFGVSEDSSAWHKFYTGWDWQPFGAFEHLSSSVSPDSCPSATSWGEGRLDVVYVDGESGGVSQTYFAGDAWGSQDLGGDDIVGVASASWGEGRLDIIGMTQEGSYVHKTWTGESWFPSDEWEDFGGFFFSDPAVVSWGAGRLDIIGLSAHDGSLRHKYYQDRWSKWENLGGGPFIGNPVATSWGPERLDFWAIDSEGELNHIYWDGSRWSDWEQLGGEFTRTPKVVHWNASKIDIVGKSLEDANFHLKSFDGTKWNPGGKDWYDMAGPFESEPGLLAKHETNFLYIFGIDEGEELRMQIWTGYDWQPGFNQTWSLGNISSSPETEVEYGKAQKPLGSPEL